MVVVAGSGVLGLIGLVGTGVEFDRISRISRSDPEGFVTGLAVAFALGFLVTSVLVLGEATLLAVVVFRSDPGPWIQGLLEVGAGAGGLAILPRTLMTVSFVGDLQASGWMIGAWILLVAVGVGASGLGLVLLGVDWLTRPEE